MRIIERSAAFKRDYRRVHASARYRKDLNLLLSEILELLIDDKELPENYFDHSLSGNWNGYRECHIKPNLLLIYSKPNTFIL